MLPGGSHATQMAHLALLASTDPEKFITMAVQANLKVPVLSGGDEDATLRGDPKTDIPITPAGGQAGIAAAPAQVQVAPQTGPNFSDLTTALGAIQPPGVVAPAAPGAGVSVNSPSGGPDPQALAQIIALLSPQPQAAAPSLGALISGRA